MSGKDGSKGNAQEEHHQPNALDEVYEYIKNRAILSLVDKVGIRLHRNYYVMYLENAQILCDRFSFLPCSITSNYVSDADL